MRQARVTTMVLALAVAWTAAGAAQQTAEQRLQAGLYQEEVQGNLQQAIAIYESILKEHAANRVVAAKAQLHIGVCYETLGLQEAQRAYQQVIDNYGDQSEVVGQARLRLAALRPAPAVAGRGPVARRLLSGEDTDIHDFYQMVPSPDGRRVAFSQMGTDGALYLRDLTSGTKERLAPGLPAVWNASPAWSPDGRRLAFSESATESRRTVVKIMDLESRSVTTVPGSEIEWTGGRATPGWMPLEWSRDGRFLLVSREPTQAARMIGILPASGGTVAILSDSASSGGGSMSPDGRYVAYAQRVSGAGQILVRPVGGGEARQLTTAAGDHSQPVWSPDGQAIAFRRSDGIWVLPMAGAAAAGTPFLAYPGSQVNPAVWTATGGLYARQYTTVTMAHQLAMEPTSGAPAGRIGALPQSITPASTFAWSPDGRRIAYDRLDGDDVVLSVRASDRDASTSYPVLAPTARRVWRLRWTDDGREVVVFSLEGMRALDPASGQVRELLPHSPGRSPLDVSPGGRLLYFVNPGQPDSVALGLYVADDLHRSGRFVAPMRADDGGPISPYVRFALSPTGDRVLFGRQANLTTGQPAPQAGTLWVVASDGTGLRRLATVDLLWSAVWDPSGRFVAYSGSDQARAVLRIVELASGTERAVDLSNPRWAMVTVTEWARDGRYIGLVTREDRFEFWSLQGLLESER